MYRADPNECFCETVEDGAALGLLGLMTGLSEEHYCAGWLDELEYRLWHAKAGDSFGFGRISERQAELLRLLSEECGGWWMWKAKGPAFVSREEWQAHLAERR